MTRLRKHPARPKFESIAPKELPAGLRVDAFILTAVDVELNAMLRHVRPLAGRNAVLKVPWRESVYYVGDCGRYTCAVAMCDKGSVGRNSSSLFVIDGIDRFKPHVVLMPGIAFGLDPTSQRYGDVLVSTQVIPYEIERVGAVKVRRGPRPEAGMTLLGRARALAAERAASRKRQRGPRFGPILSGEKLVAKKAFRNALRRDFRDAIGGEMEGAGLYAAAERRKTEWLIVKAICDWGDEAKNKTRQREAAANATEFVALLLNEPGLERSHFLPEQLKAVDMGSGNRSMTFQALSARIREATKLREEASNEAERIVQPLLEKGKAKLTDVDRRKLESVALTRNQQIEKELTAFEDGCIAYLSGDVPKELFRSSFGTEILELFSEESPHRSRLAETPSAFRALEAVHRELAVERDARQLRETFLRDYPKYRPNLAMPDVPELRAHWEWLRDHGYARLTSSGWQLREWTGE